jgi:hypothetical protein
LRLPLLIQTLTSIYFVILIPTVLKPLLAKRAAALAERERVTLQAMVSAKQAAKEIKKNVTGGSLRLVF